MIAARTRLVLFCCAVATAAVAPALARAADPDGDEAEAAELRGLRDDPGRRGGAPGARRQGGAPGGTLLDPGAAAFSKAKLSVLKKDGSEAAGKADFAIGQIFVTQ